MNWNHIHLIKISYMYLWWGFFTTDRWTLLIDPPKYAKRLSGQEHWCGVGQRPSGM